MDIKLTGIGDKNIKAFYSLMNGRTISEKNLAVGAIADGKAAGVCIFEITDDILFLDYIYVAEKYRRNGIASAMVNGFLKEVAYAEPAALHVSFPESMQDVLGLIESLHFKLFRDGISYEIDSNAFLNSEAMKKLMKRNLKNKVIRISEMTSMQKKRLRKDLEKENLFADMADDPTLSKDLSIIIFDEKDKPRSCILAKEHEEEEYVVIHCLVNFGSDSYALMDILNAFSKLVVSKYDGGCKIYFVTMNEKTEKFVEKLLGNEEVINKLGSVVSGIRLL